MFITEINKQKVELKQIEINITNNKIIVNRIKKYPYFNLSKNFMNTSHGLHELVYWLVIENNIKTYELDINIISSNHSYRNLIGHLKDYEINSISIN